MRVCYYLIYEVHYLIPENSTNAHATAHVLKKNKLYSQ